jgi:hypothetical protein
MFIGQIGKDKLSALVDFKLHSDQKDRDGFQYPIEGTECHVIFEARLDGKLTKDCWSRLPHIGVRQNWDQARSFALRIEWEHPTGSGNWRYRYVRSPTEPTMANNNVPGSLKRYAKSVAVLHWIPRPYGSIRVLQATYNFMDQSITLAPPN